MKRLGARAAALLLGGSVALLAAEGLVRGVNLARSGAASHRGGIDRPYVDHHPRFGWLPRPGIVARHRTPEFDVEYAINDHGLRQRAPPPRTRVPGRARVAFLGDSFTFGQGVDEARRFDALVSAALDIDVVNVGVPATGTDQHVLIDAELPGPHRVADLVVLGYFVEAVARNTSRERHGRPKPWFTLDAEGVLALRGVPVPDRVEPPSADPGARERGLAVPFKRTLQRHSALYALLRERFRTRLLATLGTEFTDPFPEYADDAPAWRLTRALLARLRDQVQARGARLAIAVIPEPRLLGDDAGRAFATAHARVVIGACDGLGVPALDLAPALLAATIDAAGRDGPGPVHHAVDGHWTARGHAVVADALAGFIGERALLPPHAAEAEPRTAR